MAFELPLGGIAGLALGTALLPGPDPLLRGRRPGIGAVYPQLTFQLGDPQLQPAPQLPFRAQFCLLGRQLAPLGGHLRPQPADLGVLGLDHSPQPRSEITLHPGQNGLIGHSAQACST